MTVSAVRAVFALVILGVATAGAACGRGRGPITSGGSGAGGDAGAGGLNGAGTGGAGGAGPLPVPFSIPQPPAAGALEVCGTLAPPAPLGFDRPGNALVVQAAAPGELWVRAWHPDSGALTEVIPPVPAVGAELPLLGERVLMAGEDSFRVFDLYERRFLTAAPVPRRPIAFSPDARYVLDADLVRAAVDGDAGGGDIGFAPRLRDALGATPSDVQAAAIATRGEVVAVVLPARFFSQPPAGRSGVAVLSAGQVSALDGPPVIETHRLRFSMDGHYLMASAHRDATYVWDAGTQTVAMVDAIGAVSATFTYEGHVVQVREDGTIVERDLATGTDVTWGAVALAHPLADPQAPFAPGVPVAVETTGRRALLLAASDAPANRGSVADGLRLTALPGVNEPPLGTWRFEEDRWAGAVALGAEDRLYVVETAPSGIGGAGAFPLVLSRYGAAGGPRRAMLPANESEAEWQGQVVPSPDQTQVAVVFPDSVRVVDAVTLVPSATLHADAGSVAWSPDGRLLAVTPQVHFRLAGRRPFVPGPAVELWSAVTGQRVQTLPLPVVPVSVAFDAAGERLVGTGYQRFDTSQSVVDASTGLVTLTSFFAVGDPIDYTVEIASGRASSGAGRLLAATRALGATRTEIVSLGRGDHVAALQQPLLPPDTMVSRRWSAFAPDWSTLAGMSAAASGSALALFGVADGRLLGAHAFPAVLVPGTADVSVAPGGRQVAIRNGTVTTYCLR